jgi:hypothetical protein
MNEPPQTDLKHVLYKWPFFIFELKPCCGEGETMFTFISFLFVQSGSLCSLIRLRNKITGITIDNTEYKLKAHYASEIHFCLIL